MLVSLAKVSVDELRDLLNMAHRAAREAKG
jgi:hypothetical protein